MQEAGWEPGGWNHPKQRRRQTVQDRYVKEICDELGITRASIGIFTGEAAHMYFRTGRYSIGIDDLRRLKYNGTDILIIEKEGIAEQLKDLAAPYGIALIHGRGFLTEYASELSRLAHDTGGNIAILTDFDDAGITIALQMPSFLRIGILACIDVLEGLQVRSKKKVAFPTVLKWGILAPFSFITKTQTAGVDDWLPWLYLYDTTDTGKTTLIINAVLAIWGKYDKEQNEIHFRGPGRLTIKVWYYHKSNNISHFGR